MTQITTQTPPWTWGSFRVVSGRPGHPGPDPTGWQVVDATGRAWGWGDTAEQAVEDARAELLLRLGTREMYEYVCADGRGEGRAS